jgi:hypothetical protein
VVAVGLGVKHLDVPSASTGLGSAAAAAAAAAAPDPLLARAPSVAVAPRPVLILPEYLMGGSQAGLPTKHTRSWSLGWLGGLPRGSRCSILDLDSHAVSFWTTASGYHPLARRPQSRLISRTARTSGAWQCRRSPVPVGAGPSRKASPWRSRSRVGSALTSKQGRSHEGQGGRGRVAASWPRGGLTPCHAWRVHQKLCGAERPTGAVVAASRPDRCVSSLPPSAEVCRRCVASSRRLATMPPKLVPARATTAVCVGRQAFEKS